MSRSTAAFDIASSFVRSLESATTRILTDFGRAALGEVLRAARNEEIAKAGRSGSGLLYEFHGAGCRVVDEAGREVDFDIDLEDQDTPIFDVFRVQGFAHSVGVYSLNDAEINAALKAMSAELILKVPRPGWFARATS
ncbi:MAG TPA: hypothetical protein VHO01_08460 [Jatrophihabitans sp.]|nr:hypothetical protein [Jatrophihabitans sp.]